MAMDIEKFVEAKGRDEKIKQVREKINELGIKGCFGVGLLSQSAWLTTLIFCD